MDDTSTPEADEHPLVRELTRPQRRVFGVLVEKGFTTPEYYPLTLKAVTTGCNQKSNRDPVTSYSEDAVEETLEELRRIGLVAVVHTESGRTERFRHFARKRFPFSEPQLAIITELLLRGRQQLGELRSRASRMVTIENLEELRQELEALAADNFIRASGPLERRGIEVDHAFYTDKETPSFAAVATTSDADRPIAAANVEPSAAPPAAAAAVSNAAVDELRIEIEQLKTQVSELSDDLADLKRSLGV